MTEVLEKIDWRAKAKELGIPMFQRKKEDVLADIANRERLLSPEPEAEITILPESETIIEPVEEHEPWEYEAGKLTSFESLFRRIETLENRLNSVIEAISKSKKVKGL